MGQVMELAASCEIMKKLKLIGEPFKIYKNTAFIKGMFNSQVIRNFKGIFYDLYEISWKLQNLKEEHFQFGIWFVKMSTI